MMESNYTLSRFIDAQNSEYAGYATALAEIKAGRKVCHWIWYIFPQIKGLGFSYNSQYYGIWGKEEAKQYLEDSVLGARLREISSELLKHSDKGIVSILGSIDALKVKSSMSLFDMVSPDDVFKRVLDTFYNGERDVRTLQNA